MTTQTHEQLLESVKNTLQKNGFPEQHVALPLERMYEVAHTKGLNFNKILSMLEEQGITHKKEGNRIIFAPKSTAAEQPATDDNFLNAFKGLNLENLDQGHMKDLMEQASKMVQQMPPEELEKVMSLYQNMSEQDREELAKKAADLGLLK